MPDPTIHQGAPIDIETGQPVPTEDIPRAVASGRASWLRGTKVRVRAPDGTVGVVPAEKVHLALRSEYQLLTPEEQSVQQYKEEKGESSVAGVIAREALSVATSGTSDVIARTVKQAQKENSVAGVLGAIRRGVLDLPPVKWGPVGQASAALERYIGTDVMPGGAETPAAIAARDEMRAQELHEATEFPGSRQIGTVLGLLAPMGGPTALARAGVKSAGQLGALAYAGGTLPTTAVRQTALALGRRAAPGGGIVGKATEYGVSGAVEGASFTMGRELASQARGDPEYDYEKIVAAGLPGAALGAGFGVAVGGTFGTLSAIMRRAGKESEKVLTAAEGAATAGARAEKGIQSLNWQQALRARAFGLTASDLDTLGEANIIKVFNEAEKRGLFANLKGRGEFARRLHTMKESVGSEIGSTYTRVGKLADAEAVRNKATLDSAVKALVETRERGAGALARGDAAAYARANGDAAAIFQLIKRTGGDTRQFQNTGMLSAVATRIGQLRGTGIGPDVKLARKLTKDWVPGIEKLRTFADAHALTKKLRWAELNSDKPGVAAELRNFYGLVKGALREEVKRVSTAEHSRLLALDDLYTSLQPISETIATRAIGAQATRLPMWDVTIAGAGAMHGRAAEGLGTVAVRRIGASDKIRLAMADALDVLRDGGDRQAAIAATGVDKLYRKGSAIPGLATAKSGLSRITGADANIAARNYAIDWMQTHQMLEQPERFAARLERQLSPLAQVDPGAAAGAAKLIAGDMAYLKSKAPKATLPPTAAGLHQPPEYRVSPSEAAAQSRRVRALSSPFETAAKIGDGKLGPEDIEVVKDRRPEMVARLHRNLTEVEAQLAAKGQAMPYDVRIQASLVTGRPFDATMDAAFIMKVQSIWQSTRAMAEPQPGPGRPKKLQPPSKIKNLKTVSEELKE